MDSILPTSLGQLVFMIAVSVLPALAGLLTRYLTAKVELLEAKVGETEAEPKRLEGSDDEE